MSELCLILFQREHNPTGGYSAARRISVYPKSTQAIQTAYDAVMYGFDAWLVGVREELLELSDLLDFIEDAIDNRDSAIPIMSLPAKQHPKSTLISFRKYRD